MAAPAATGPPLSLAATWPRSNHHSAPALVAGAFLGVSTMTRIEHTLQTYLDLARAELKLAARNRACGYVLRANVSVEHAKYWIAEYWAAKPRG